MRRQVNDAHPEAKSFDCQHCKYRSNDNYALLLQKIEKLRSFFRSLPGTVNFVPRTINHEDINGEHPGTVNCEDRNSEHENLAGPVKAAESLNIIGLAAPEEGVLNKDDENQKTTMQNINNVNMDSNDLLPNAKRKTTVDENDEGTRYAEQGYGENVEKRKENNSEDFDASNKKETIHLVKDARDTENHNNDKYGVIDEQVCYSTFRIILSFNR